MHCVWLDSIEQLQMEETFWVRKYSGFSCDV